MLWAFLRIFRRGTHRGAGSESLPTETPNTLAQTNPVIEICSCNNGADHTLRGVDLGDEQAALTAPFEERFKAAMNDDFNTPEAYSVLFDLARDLNRAKQDSETDAVALAACLRRLGGVLGILQQQPEQFLQSGAAVGADDVAEIELLIKTRNDARASKNWALADEARNKLTEMGIVLEDGAQGTTWRRKG